MASLPPRFAILSVLGRSPAATVYAVFDAELERRVAVKILTEEAAADTELRARFRREARAAGRLGGHPHVLTVHDAGAWEGRPYLVMELLEGGTLGDRVRRGPVTAAEALAWLEQAAGALDAAHAAGIVHRDLKPANLLLDGSGALRVADFGIAHDAGTTAITDHGVVLGTAGYMAPEQLAGARAVPATDQYALAVVARDLLAAVEPEPAPAAQEVLARALGDDPEGRFPSTLAFVAALAAALDRPELATRRTFGLARTQAYVTRAEPARRGRGARIARALATAAVFALVAALSVLAGELVALKLADRGGTAAPVTVSSCTASPAGHDANVVVTGPRPDALCRSLAAQLASTDVTWTIRDGRSLVAPDSGDPSRLSVVCRLRRGPLRLTVYDDGGQAIGRALCAGGLGPSWNEAGVA